MMRPIIALGTLAVALVSTSADAAIYSGNPHAGFHIDRVQGDLTHGDVYVDKLRIHNCGGGYTDYSVKQWVDPVAGFEKTISGGDLCAATWYWGSDTVLNGPGFEITGTPATTTVNLDPIKTIDFLPWSLTDGRLPSNGAVKFYTTMD